MTAFTLHFLFCNIPVSVILGVILLAKRLLGKHLSGCGRYRIWHLLPVIFAVPFLPLRPAGLLQPASRLCPLKTIKAPSPPPAAAPGAGAALSGGRICDFAVSVARDGIPAAGRLLFVLWAAGMPAMLLLMIKARVRLHLRLISDSNAADIRYMLLHELQHYKQRDAILSFLHLAFPKFYRIREPAFRCCSGS